MAIQRVLLSSVDQLMPTSYIRLFLVVRTGGTDLNAAIEQLQRGLNRTQRQLPYIGGAIFKAASGRIGIEWEQAEGPPQIEIVPPPNDLPSSAQLETAEHPFSDVWRIGRSSDRFGDVEIRDGLPAVTIICSQLDKYIVLGVSCFHSLWDIAGLSVFLHLWSRNTKRPSGDVNLSLVEDITLRDSRLRQSLRHVKDHGSKSFQTNLEVFPASPADHIGNCTLQLDVSKLKALGRQLSPSPDRSISANDLAIAVIWTSISLHRLSSANNSPELPRLRILVDGRKHVFNAPESKIPYLGNLALPLFSYFSKSQVLESTQPETFSHLLATATDAIQSSSQQASPASFVEAISTLDELPNASAIRESSAVYNTKQLTSTSWSQAPMYVDFGAHVGKVHHVRIAPDDYELEGMILTLPRKRDESGGSKFFEIFVSGRVDELERLRNSEAIRSLAFIRPESDVKSRSRAKI